MQGGRPLLLAAAASGRAGRGMNRAPRLRVSHPVSGSRPEPGDHVQGRPWWLFSTMASSFAMLRMAW